MEKDFITPPNHVNFLAKQLFGSSGEIEDVAVAHLQSNGGVLHNIHIPTVICLL